MKDCNIEVYRNPNPANKKFPWRVRINGEEDPRNRDFENKADLLDSFKALNDEGYYKGAVIKFPDGTRYDLDTLDLNEFKI